MEELEYFDFFMGVDEVELSDVNIWHIAKQLNLSPKDIEELVQMGKDGGRWNVKRNSVVWIL